MEWNEIFGHILGFVAVGLFFLSYQIREKKPLLFVQTAATVMICIQYLLIGAYSGFALNVVCVIRNFVYFHRDKKLFSGLFFPILFSCLMPVISIFTWEGYHSLLIILALMINTVCLAVCSTQNLRKSILLTSAMILIYNIWVMSIGGMISESVSIISAVIGLIRFAKDKKIQGELAAQAE